MLSGVPIGLEAKSGGGINKGVVIMAIAQFNGGTGQEVLGGFGFEERSEVFDGGGDVMLFAETTGAGTAKGAGAT